MKKLLVILILAFGVSAQTPRTVYNKDKTRLTAIYGLADCSESRKTFAGIISRALVSASSAEYAFDLGKESFWLSFAGLSDADQAKLSDFIKQGNRVSATGCSQENGIWRVTDIKLR